MTDRRIRSSADLEALTFRGQGLVPVVTQEVGSGRVLMVAFADREALERTLKTGQMHYWSRSRQALWHKGATSGNYQALVSLHGDCDGDAVLARVRPQGPACHTGEATCFGEIEPDGDEEGLSPERANREEPSPESPGSPEEDGADRSSSRNTLLDLWAVLRQRKVERPPGSYTVRLLEDENLRVKKLGEETAELVMALARDARGQVVEESADLIYHLLAALLAAGVEVEEVFRALEARRG